MENGIAIITGTMYAQVEGWWTEGTCFSIYEDKSKIGYQSIPMMEVIKWEDGTYSDHCCHEQTCEFSSSIVGLIDIAIAEFNKVCGLKQDSAKQAAYGDETFEHILRVAMEYAGVKSVEKLYPHIENNIAFFQVGRNASHEFYLGRRDGETWKMSIGEGMEEDEYGIPVLDKHIRKLGPDESFGYCGHF